MPSLRTAISNRDPDSNPRPTCHSLLLLRPLPPARSPPLKKKRAPLKKKALPQKKPPLKSGWWMSTSLQADRASLCLPLSPAAATHHSCTLPILPVCSARSGHSVFDVVGTGCLHCTIHVCTLWCALGNGRGGRGASDVRPVLPLRTPPSIHEYIHTWFCKTAWRLDIMDR